MAVELLKSASLTNLDSSPPVRSATGVGGRWEERVLNDFITVPAATSIASILRVVRIPSNAVVKQVILETEAQAAGAADIGLYYSANTNDSPGATRLAGAVIDVDLFGSAVSVATAAKTDVTNESGNYTLNLRNQPIWQAAGLTSDPGGYFDVALTFTTAVTTGAARTGLEVRFAN